MDSGSELVDAKWSIQAIFSIKKMQTNYLESVILDAEKGEKLFQEKKNGWTTQSWEQTDAIFVTQQRQ